MNEFKRWLRATQETAVNHFGYTTEQADALDIIDLGLLYDADLTPYEAMEEFVGADSRTYSSDSDISKKDRNDMFQNYLEDTYG